jgi:hypothetical protein
VPVLSKSSSNLRLQLRLVLALRTSNVHKLGVAMATLRHVRQTDVGTSGNVPFSQSINACSGRHNSKICAHISSGKWYDGCNRRSYCAQRPSSSAVSSLAVCIPALMCFISDCTLIRATRRHGNIKSRIHETHDCNIYEPVTLLNYCRAIGLTLE